MKIIVSLSIIIAIMSCQRIDFNVIDYVNKSYELNISKFAPIVHFSKYENSFVTDFNMFLIVQLSDEDKNNLISKNYFSEDNHNFKFASKSKKDLLKLFSIENHFINLNINKTSNNLREEVVLVTKDFKYLIIHIESL